MATLFEKDPMMVGRKIAEEFILVPIMQDARDSQCIYTLNDVGARIWELLDGNGVTIDDIVSAITQQYEVEAPQAEADVVEFLEQMKEIGAVVERNEGG
jgi:hypothetical protein